VYVRPRTEAATDIATHRRVNDRPENAWARGMFGWSRSYRPGVLPEAIASRLRAAGLAQPVDAASVDAAEGTAPAGWRYEELDPDVFGDQLGRAGHEQVERIAAVWLHAVKRG
jgi:hypothetical protein